MEPAASDREMPHAWPAAMRADTLKAYLDCRSDADFARKLKELRSRGYPGKDPVLNRHIREVVDRYLTNDRARGARIKREMLGAAGAPNG